MIFPLPDLIISLETALETRKVPLKSTFITSSRSASVISITGF